VLVQGLRFIHKVVKKITPTSMEFIHEELKKSMAELSTRLIVMEADLEFGGLRMIPIQLISGKLVTPVIDLKVTAGQLTYKM
jgi:hypothetical protein